MTKQLETLYMVFDIGWGIFVRPEPYTLDELRQLASEMAGGSPEELEELCIDSMSHFEMMEPEELDDILGWVCSWEIREVSKLQEATGNE